jgi:hypothetical protein
MRVWSDPSADFVLRLVVLAVLVLIAYFAVFQDVIKSSSEGSRAAAALATQPLPLSVAVSASAVPVVCSALLYRFTVAGRRPDPLGGGLARNEGSGKTTLPQRLPDPGLQTLSTSATPPSGLTALALPR